YVLDDLAAVVVQPPIIIGRGGRGIPNPNINKASNLLVALDLARQGYQLWAVGGTTGDNPALAGAFFLGPPLPLGDLLYAIAEFNGEIRLVCLDPRSGNVEWKQPLAILLAEQPMMYDCQRHLACASPSLADGKEAWKASVKLDGELVGGRGYYSDKYYYLPVTGKQLFKIDLESGQVVAKAQTEVELGNLVCYSDQLL